MENNLEKTLSDIKYDGIMLGVFEELPNLFSVRSVDEVDFSDLKEKSEYFEKEDNVSFLHQPIRGIKRIKSSTLIPDKFIEYKGTKKFSKGLLTEIQERKSIKTKDIIKLEETLSAAYKTKVSITRINELPQIRKQVKEVFFLINNGVSKVWVFKAEPEKTARELITYNIIYRHGIPTGKPICLPQSIKEYPYDIAILGGIVQNAGEPYNDLIKNLQLKPETAFQTALSIAEIIANYHTRLTLAIKDFENNGIELEKSIPEKEIKRRLLGALGVNGDFLIKACNEFYKKQTNNFVISHGDLHTGNIVTISKTDCLTGMPSTSIKRFGIIDWEDICLDNPYSDLRNFSLHYLRNAKKVFSDFSFPFEKIEYSYMRKLKNLNERFGLDLDIDNNSKDSLIQSALWNLYEMYDPLRKEEKDIKEKAVFHCSALWNDLKRLEDFGLKKETYRIKKELNKLLNDKEYLRGIIKL